MWSKYPDSKPEKSGYYMTAYYNNKSEGYYCKAIYYNNSRDKWLTWRSDLEPIVYEYMESSHDNYYCHCIDKAKQLLNEEEQE